MDYMDWIIKANAARKISHTILSGHESSISRVILLEGLFKQLSGAPVDVQDYFKESISCLEGRLFRAGIVMSWAGYFHMFTETLYQNHEKDIQSVRPKWKFRSLNELKEQHAEAQILDVGKVVKFINNSTLLKLRGQLSTRNQCAHPTLYKPSMNVAIGYVDEMIAQTLKYITP